MPGVRSFPAQTRAGFVIKRRTPENTTGNDLCRSWPESVISLGSHGGVGSWSALDGSGTVFRPVAQDEVPGGGKGPAPVTGDRQTLQLAPRGRLVSMDEGLEFCVERTSLCALPRLDQVEFAANVKAVSSYQILCSVSLRQICMN